MSARLTSEERLQARSVFMAASDAFQGALRLNVPASVVFPLLRGDELPTGMVDRARGALRSRRLGGGE